MIDYFTRAAFRSFAGDPGGATPTYSDADIDAAQGEVIEHLEQWARSAWPNVTGADGDGTAATRRSTTETFDGGEKIYSLSRFPVATIVSMTVDSNVLAAADFYSYLDEGYIAVDEPVGLFPRGIEIEYTYGFAATPYAVKRAAMMATKSLLDQKRGRGSKIPANTSQYTTESTTFVLDQDDAEVRPWPWDQSASENMRSYWGSERPPLVGAI